MTSFFSSFFQKIILILLVLSVLPVFLIANYLYTDKINSETEFLQNRLLTTSEIGSHNIEHWIVERMSDVNDIANNQLIIENTKKLTGSENEQELFKSKFLIQKEFNTILNSHTWFQDLRISNPETGETIFYTGLHQPELEMFESKHFQSALNGDVGISEIFPSKNIIKNENGFFEKGVPTMLISAPIKGEVGLGGILTARVDVFQIDSHMDDIILDFKSANSYIINSQGYLLSKPSYTKILYDLNQFEIRPELEFQLFNDNFYNEIFGVQYDSSYGLNLEGYENPVGDTVIGSISPIDGTDWSFIIEVNKNEAFFNINYLQIILLSSIGIILFTISGISLYFSNYLISPILNLKSVFEQISSGNFNTKIESFGNKELAELAISFDSMAKSLNDTQNLLESTAKKYKDLYDDSPVLNRTIDLKGKIVDCNKSYCLAFGYEKHEIIGKSIFDFVTDDDKNNLIKSFNDWKKKGFVKNREIIFKKKNGSFFPGILSANNLYDEKENLIGSNTSIIDITAIREAQKEIQELKFKRLSAIGELTARIAHDMRNPLSVIKNTVDIMMMDKNKFDDSTKDNLERLERGIYRIKHQVDDVLDYVKLGTINKKYTKLTEILQSSVDRMEIPENVSIHMPKSDIVIPCDSERMEAVFVNLIYNSIQAMDKKSGQIFITIEESPDNMIGIIIKDTGPGIPDYLISKVFEPLFTTKQSGTGLGLPSCKNIVEKHGGTISAKSHDKGGHFIIQLPKFTEWDEIQNTTKQESLNT